MLPQSLEILCRALSPLPSNPDLAPRLLFIFKKDLFIYHVYSVLPALMSACQKRAPDLILVGCMRLLGIELRTFGGAVSVIEL